LLRPGEPTVEEKKKRRGEGNCHLQSYYHSRASGEREKKTRVGPLLLHVFYTISRRQVERGERKKEKKK